MMRQVQIVPDPEYELYNLKLCIITVAMATEGTNLAVDLWYERQTVLTDIAPLYCSPSLYHTNVYRFNMRCPPYSKSDSKDLQIPKLKMP